MEPADDEEKELRQFKHLPKAQILEATQNLFSKRVKELTYPNNPTLFAADQKSNKRQSQTRGANTSHYHTINSSVITTDFTPHLQSSNTFVSQMPGRMTKNADLATMSRISSPPAMDQNSLQ